MLALKHDNAAVAVSLVALTGYAMAGTEVFPWALMGLATPDPSTKGFAMGMVTLCIVIPQFVDTIYVGVLAELVGLHWVVFLGGCYASIACIATSKLPAAPESDVLPATTLPS